MRTATLVVLAILALMWGLSLYMAPYLFFAFDSPVSLNEALALGSLQATWVAGIPVVLLWSADFTTHGWRGPRWVGSWGALIVGPLLWGAIVGFWVLASVTSDPYA